MLVTAKPGRGKKIHVSVDGEYTFTTNSDFWYSYGFTGGEMTEEEFEKLKESSDYRLALNKALDLLSVRDYARRELIKKLTEKFGAEAAEKAANRAEELGMLDDRKFAENAVRSLAEFRGMGKRRIKNELFMKGVSADIADEVLENYEFDEQEALMELLSGKYRKMMADEKGRQRAFAALVRRGYNYSDIRSAMQNYADSEFFYED